MLFLLPCSPSAPALTRSTNRTAAEELLDQAEGLLLRRNHPGNLDLTTIIAVFGALVDEARRHQDVRVEALAVSSQRLLQLLQQRREGMRLETEDLLLDAVDRIQALLRQQAADEIDVHRSLERRILALST